MMDSTALRYIGQKTKGPVRAEMQYTLYSLNYTTMTRFYLKVSLLIYRWAVVLPEFLD